MIDDAALDRMVRDAAHALRTPGSTEIEREWSALAARRRERAWRKISWGFGGALAAGLALGIFLGRWSTPSMPGFSPALRGIASRVGITLPIARGLPIDRVVLRELVVSSAPSTARLAALDALLAEPDSETVAVVSRAAADPSGGAFALAAASRLPTIDADGIDSTVLRTLVDTLVPLAQRQAVLYGIREGAKRRPSEVALRELFDRLPTVGTMQITLIEIVAGIGGTANEEWLRQVAIREVVPARTRVAALQHMGEANRLDDLVALFGSTDVQLVRFAVLEQLRSRAGPDVTATLQRIRNALPAGVMRDAADASIEAQAKLR